MSSIQSQKPDSRAATWASFLDGLVSQSGRNIALISAIVGAAWVISSEFRQLHVAIAQVQVRITTSGKHTDEKLDKISNGLDKLEGSVDHLRLSNVATESRLARLEDILGAYQAVRQPASR